MISALLDHPILVLLISLLSLWASASFGSNVLRRRWALDADLRNDYQIVMGAMLTMLGLIIGFSLSMATNRYDQRKNLEEAEANAIGTEYVRADLLPMPAAEQVRALLKEYLGQRTLYYTTRDDERLTEINARTLELQGRLWSAVAEPARAQPSPIMSLVAAGMNDVLNSQGYSEAAWRNRIPGESWLLMAVIAIACHLMIGYGAQSTRRHAFQLFMLPPVIAVAFFLIADIDSPRGGVIRVSPHNLYSLAESLH